MFCRLFPRKVTRESDLIDLAVLRERKHRFRQRKKFKPFRGCPGTYYALHREERLSYQHQYYRDKRQRLRFGLKSFENYSEVIFMYSDRSQANHSI